MEQKRFVTADSLYVAVQEDPQALHGNIQAERKETQPLSPLILQMQSFDDFPDDACTDALFVTPPLDPDSPLFAPLTAEEAFEEALARGVVALDVRTALRDLVADLEARSDAKMGDQKGVVDCGNGVYRRALAALANAEEPLGTLKETAHVPV